VTLKSQVEPVFFITPQVHQRFHNTVQWVEAPQEIHLLNIQHQETTALQTAAMVVRVAVQLQTAVRVERVIV